MADKTETTQDPVTGAKTEHPAPEAHVSKEPAPTRSIRADGIKVSDTDTGIAGPTKEQQADADRREKLLAEPEDEHPTGKDAPTTDHIPHYGETHATPGVPYQENPLNPGMNPAILPGAPRQ